MKLKALTKTLALLALALFIVAADYVTPDMIPRGTDVNSIRCSGKLVFKGDFFRNVLEQCNEPLRETRVVGEPYRVLVYRFGQSNYVYYLAFFHEKLQRIYRVRCRGDNPDCK